MTQNRQLITATRNEVCFSLNLKSGTLPDDWYGHVFINSPAGTVNSGGLPYPAGSREQGSPIMNGDGYVFRFDLGGSNVEVQTALMKPPCYYADEATKIGNTNGYSELYSFFNCGLSRLSPMLGARNELNTAITPVKFDGDTYPRMIACYDAGKPWEFNPVSLEMMTAIGNNNEYAFATPEKMFPLPVIETTAHPIYDSEGQPIVVPDWNFPGRGRVQQQLTRAKTLANRAERVLQTLPLRGTQAAWSAKLEERRLEIERALEYVELYGLYTECEAIYSVDNLLALWNQLDAADQEAFCFDPRVIDWDHYVQNVHLPSVVEHARVKTTPGKSKTDRSTRLRSNVLSPQRQVAAFDLENTLIASNVVESYSWLATRRLNGPERLRYVMRTMVEAPTLLSMDRKDRGDFLRYFYRRYEDAPVAQIEVDAREMLTQIIVAKSFPAAIRRVREHRALGHKTILITGALSFNVEGLRPLFDEIVAAEMSVRPDGTYSGQLTQVPPTGETRAQVLSDYCAANGYSLDECVAYADSTSDLPLLEAVGHPVAVNPETRLAAIARKRGWLVEEWSKAAGAPKRLLPIAPMMNEKMR
jgi:HAD superfamily hydrolase (TIGR01490 family)